VDLPAILWFMAACSHVCLMSANLVVKVQWHADTSGTALHAMQESRAASMPFVVTGCVLLENGLTAVWEIQG
jgi:hypothetical protein